MTLVDQLNLSPPHSSTYLKKTTPLDIGSTTEEVQRVLSMNTQTSATETTMTSTAYAEHDVLQMLDTIDDDSENYSEACHSSSCCHGDASTTVATNVTKEKKARRNASGDDHMSNNRWIRRATPVVTGKTKKDAAMNDDDEDVIFPSQTNSSPRSSMNHVGIDIGVMGGPGFKWESELWSNFIERAMEMKHYSKARQHDSSSNNPLHDTSTPLYEAVSMKAPPYIISRLIKVHPQATKIQNDSGYTPLHCAIERYDTSEEVLAMLLNADPATARLKDCKGNTPVDLMWKRYVAPEPYRSESIKAKANIRRRAMEYLVINKGWSSLMLDDILKHSSDEGPLLREFWVIFSKFLRAFYGLGLPIHAVLAMEAPDPLLVRLVTALYPSHLQVAEPKSGFLPLHMVAYKNANNDRILETTRSLFIILDNADRSACAVTDNRGRLPFHLALLRGKPWMFLKLLVAAYPRVLHLHSHSQQVKGLSAFQFASSIVTNGDNNGESLSCVDMSTVFLLLRADPSVLQKYCP